MKVRRAGVEDAAAIARIHTESWRRHYRGMYSDRYLDGDLYADRLVTWTERLRRDASVYFTLVAEDEDSAIGFVHLVLDADPTWGALVDNLHVAHSAQRRGVGSVLLDGAAAIVRERRGESGMYLWVLEGNVDAQKFYVAKGGMLRDRELAAPPGKDARNLNGEVKRIRVSWDRA